MPNLALLALAAAVGPSLGALQEREPGEDPWDYEIERIEFRAFDAASWDPESDRLLEAVARFLSAYRELVGSDGTS